MNPPSSTAALEEAQATTGRSLFRSGIGRRLIVYTLLFSVAITLITTAVQVNKEYQRDLRRLEQRIEFIRTGYLNSLSNSLWAMDMPQLQVQLKGIKDLPDIQYVEIRKGDKLFGKAGENTAKHMIVREFPLEYESYGRQVELGIFKISVGLEELRAQLWERVFFTLLSQGVQIFFVSLFIFTLVQYMITRHLCAVAAYASQLRTDNLDNPLALKRSTKRARHDELDQLAGSINSMRRYLSDAYKTAEAGKQAAEQAREELRVLNQELEYRVKERTHELARANEEITLLNKSLHAENQRMSMELEVTRRLQQMVLPRREELQGVQDLDIAGYMEPADEVGGDYYDVLHHQNGVKIGIGDVTGHGLESGVLMLMVQTAVRALMTYGVSDPRVFLCTLNRIIYDNVQRMDSDKNLTLSLLDYNEGRLTLSGQHEEVLLLRGNGEIERIDTLDLGFMVGLVDDISNFVKTSEIHLQPGETAVLYTDGITEAFNEKDEPYGLERLCIVLKQHKDEEAAHIQQAVIEDVRGHLSGKLQDDITLLVIKRRQTL